MWKWENKEGTNQKPKKVREREWKKLGNWERDKKGKNKITKKWESDKVWECDIVKE
jgi:hypothetical protein